MRNLPSLESLELGGPTRLSDFVLGELPTLKRLTIAGTRSRPFRRLALDCLAGLESLTLHNVRAGEVLLRRLPSLRELDVAGLGVIQLDCSDLPSLERVSLRRPRGLTVLTVQNLARLAQLRITDADHLSGLRLLDLPALRELLLPGCHRFADAWLTTLGERLPGCRVGR